MKLSGWGRFPQIESEFIQPGNEHQLKNLLKEGDLIAHGNGRSYGDSALHKNRTVDMKGFNHLISFDEKNGVLTAESGVLLSDIIDIFMPRGWFPSVTPGTKFVTLGGAIAADVHGKNHHKEGSFGTFVEWMDILDQNGDVLRCSRSEHSELFHWTIGGMGLTGIILRASIKLKPIQSAWIKQKKIPAKNLDHVFKLFEENHDATYSVAWIDCLSHNASLGRSILMLGEHATISDLPDKRKDDPFKTIKIKGITVPFDFPSIILNKYSVKLFNQLYYHLNRLKSGHSLTDWNTFFYPLDSLNQWNRIYGKKGFTQFQCVLPMSQSKNGMKHLLETISKSGMGSFLAVLKQFGDEESKFSFPMSGYTLALDFPINHKTADLMKKLHQITLEYDGRIYLAKDAHLTAEMFKKSDSRVKDFINFRIKKKLNDSFNSLQSNRLEL